MKERVLNILCNMLGISSGEFDENLSFENMSSWNSLFQIEIVVALEQEFSVEFAYNEIAEMLSCKDIVRIINAKISKRHLETI
ncbi:MAG: acyl carrier protein [Oligoflexia bacterium]|nr:acyl carrier protein [Oligoflexia bacterium]